MPKGHRLRPAGARRAVGGVSGERREADRRAVGGDPAAVALLSLVVDQRCGLDGYRSVVAPVPLSSHAPARVVCSPLARSVVRRVGGGGGCRRVGVALVWSASASEDRRALGAAAVGGARGGDAP